MWKEKQKHGNSKESEKMQLVQFTVLKYKHMKPKTKNK
jgi:hypothetical protein